ncbi:hypothetical protein G6L37_05770 [Agrobacterium rubi]|nr:hypothetical protein [Agrobacterium rubi]NTF24867.1 hypothetical protein [Agrobacterium rubi]
MNFFGRRLSAMSILAAGLLAICGVVASFAYDTAVTRLGQLDDVMSAAVPLDDPAKTKSLDGRIVIATGTAAPAEDLRDTAFNLSVPAIKLMRESQIYQWEQTGSKFKTYEKGWSQSPVDSYFFERTHKNTGRISYPTQVNTASSINLVQSDKRLALLDPSFAQFLGGQMKLMISWNQYKAMPADIRLRFDLVDGSLLEKAAAAGEPRIGDNRTRFMMVPPHEVTVVGMLISGRIMSMDRSLNPIGILLPGKLDVADVREAITAGIIGDVALPGFLALALWAAGMIMFRTDFRNAPKVIKPTKPIRLGR